MEAMAARTVPAIDSRPGARERIGRLFDRHHRRLFRLALRMTGERESALDLVQEAFLRAARKPGSLPATESGQEAWLVRVVVNLCRDRYRRHEVRRRSLPRLRDQRAEPASPEDAAVARTTVGRALRSLPAKRRAIVVLRELEGLPIARIARLVGLRQATVRWHLSVARRSLAATLTPPRRTDRKETP